MINGIDNGILVTDLDANSFRILNVGSIVPPPPNLVATTDPRLTDARAPIDGSVTDASVNASAFIDQSKLNLNGNIPLTWLGLDATHAAPGNLSEYLINKGIANGYAGLDGSGKVPVGQLPNTIGTGTVTSVALAMPGDFTVSGSPVTTTGTITVGWANVADGTWFGNSSGGSAVPLFNTTPVTVGMVPPLPASQITTGTLSPAILPAAVGVGPTSSSGIVPDPGPTGNTTDYLSRDMTYKPVPTIGPAYQPKVSSPILSIQGSGIPMATIQITCLTVNALLFYVLSPNTIYAEIPTSGLVTVASGQTLSTYGARAGYTNSDISTFSQP